MMTTMTAFQWVCELEKHMSRKEMLNSSLCMAKITELNNKAELDNSSNAEVIYLRVACYVTAALLQYYYDDETVAYHLGDVLEGISHGIDIEVRV